METKKIILCADCGRPTDAQHECKQQRAANRRAQKRRGTPAKAWFYSTSFHGSR